MLVFVKKATRSKILAGFCVVLVLLGARIGAEMTRSPYALTEARANPIKRVPTSRPEAALLVDLVSADPQTVRELADALGGAGIKVTWFASATWVESNAELVGLLVREGHEFGVKGTDDRRVDRLPDEELRLRLVRSRQALAAAGVEAVPFFYPPEGKLSERGVTVVLEEGFHTVLGGVDLRRLAGKPERIDEKLSILPGDIALAEIRGKKVRPPVTLVQAIGSWAKTHGLGLVRVSDLVRGVR